MKKILAFAIAAMMLMAFSSCTVSQHVANNNYKTPFKPTSTRLSRGKSTPAIRAIWFLPPKL